MRILMDHLQLDNHSPLLKFISNSVPNRDLIKNLPADVEFKDLWARSQSLLKILISLHKYHHPDWLLQLMIWTIWPENISLMYSIYRHN